MTDSLVYPTVFELIVAVVASVVTCGLALVYLRRVRLERPVIGTFNRRDIGILFSFIVLLPLLYVVLPQWLLTAFLLLTFTASISIGYRPLLAPALLWPAVGLLIGLNIWMARNLLGTVLGWQVYWVENSILVVLGAVAVANLYAQGGMRLKHVSWFALVLAVYDAVFTLKWPITNELAERFLGYPLDPSVAFRMGIFNASIGIGDLLVYALFMIIAFKAYGWSAARLAMAVVVVFGAMVPALAPLLFRELIDARTDLVVPAQSAFGPVAFACYLWFRHRYGAERTMVQFLASTDVPRSAAVVVPAAVPSTEAVPASA
jgi:hypothetical protein